MKVTRIYNWQMDSEFQDRYYDREQAAIDELEKLGTVEDTYHSRRATVAGIDYSEANWQGVLRQVNA